MKIECIIDSSIRGESKFLVVCFDRYDTTQSVHKFVEASGFKEAALESGWYEEETDPDMKEIADEEYSFQQVNDKFACVPGEEEDILIYLL